jgi:hypothetical protein
VDRLAPAASGQGEVDVLDAGTGDDRLEAAGGPSTEASCGAGRDVVRFAREALVRSTADCEGLRFAQGSGSGDGTVRLLGGGRVAVRCPAARTRSRRCRVAATARRAGRTLGSARATAPPRGTARLTLGRRVRGRSCSNWPSARRAANRSARRLVLALPR